MKTLVTGSTGLLGNNVVRRWIEQGDAVRVLVRASSDARAIDGLPVEVAQGDVRNEDDVMRAMRGVDRVVHCAAHVRIGRSEGALARAINVTGTQNVCRAARAEGARMVHVSSVDALGLGKRGEPADEDTPRIVKWPCPYVLTKREGEEVVRSEIERGLWAVIVNPGFMMGPWDWKPSSGRMMIQVTRFQPLVAPVGGASLCDVRDVATGIGAAFERGESGRSYVMAGENLSFRAIWTLFARAARSRAPRFPMGPLIRIGASVFGDLWSLASGRESEINSAAVRMAALKSFYRSDRAVRELGYPMRPAEQTVGDAWSWFRGHGYVR